MARSKVGSTGRPKVSVVVPIYNVEKYLRKCVDSILAQSLKEIEVILIDDGSPDKCGEIIDGYAKADKRVKAVHQKNSGYSISVNKGIDLARGEYIGIIESDDFIEKDMYEKLYADAKKNKTDVTKGLFYYYNPTLPKAQQNKVYENPMYVDLRYAPAGAFKLSEWPRMIGFHASIWSSIYRADFIKKIKIPDTAGASYQDFPFMCAFLTKAARISVVKKPFVHWRNEPKQGNSTSAGGKKLLFMPENTLRGLSIVDKSGLYQEVKEPLMAHAFWTNIGFFFKIDQQYKQKYYNYLKEIFGRLKDDAEFSYKYFRKEDKLGVKVINSKDNWRWLYMVHIYGGLRRKGNKILRMIGVR